MTNRTRNLLLAGTAIAVVFGAAAPAGFGFPSRGGFVAPAVTPPPPDAFAVCLATANVNEWIDLGTCAGAGAHPTLLSAFYSTQISPGPTPATIQGATGSAAIMASWGGAAWDPDNFQLIAWGGGHNDYHGNEVYTFKLKTLDWNRITLPDNLDSNGCSANGGPSATHTYSSITYNTALHFFQSAGDMATSGPTPPCANNTFWTMNPATAPLNAYQAWTGRDLVPNISFAQLSIYDPSVDRTYVAHCAACNGGTVGLRVVNLNASPGSQVSIIGDATSTSDNETATLYPPTRKMIGMGPAKADECAAGCIDIIDLAAGTKVVRGSVSGDSTCFNLAAPGLSYDANIGKMRVWCGGKPTYTLDVSVNPPTLTLDPVAAGGATPQCDQAANCSSTTGYQIRGTFSRFQCLQPTYNACIVVNTTTARVYAKKLGSAITTLQTVSTGSGTKDFTTGMVFAKGAATPGAIVTDALSSQVVCKRTWNDGSCKHAIISGTYSSSANVQSAVHLSSGTPPGGTNLTCASITTANPSATVNLGTSGTVNLSSLFAAPVRTWISGPEMVECDYSAVASGGELVLFYVKEWKDGKIKVDVMVENGAVTGSTDKAYTPVITIGGVPVYSPGAITHSANTGYYATGWIGGDPVVTVQHAMPDVVATKLVPNYFMDTPSAAILNAETQTYTPFGHADISTDMASTGPQNQIGWLGLWDALWITSLDDSRAQASGIANALSIYSYGIIWRDPATNAIITPSGFPTSTPNNLGGTDGIFANGLNWERSHHGSAGYLAYMMTGDYFFLEAMYLQASLSYLTNDNGSYGSGVNRYLGGQIRSRAWQIRTITQMTAIAPNSDSAIYSDYQTLLNNLALKDITTASQVSFPQLGVVYSYNNGGGGWGSPGVGGTSTLNGTTPPWMHNFGYWSVAMGTDIEWGTTAQMTNWATAEAFQSKWPVNLFGPGGAGFYCFNYASAYGLEVTVANNNTDTILGQWWTTWGALASSTFNLDGTVCGNVLQGTSGGDPATGATSYYANANPAASLAKDHGYGDGITRFTGATNYSTYRNAAGGNAFSAYPIFGVKPRSGGQS